MLAGDGLFNNLYYSFAVSYEDGTFVQDAPGGGSDTLRTQLSFLCNYLEQFNFIKFSPDGDLDTLAPGTYAYAISNKKNEFIVYLTNRICRNIQLRLPTGKYKVEWMNLGNGMVVSKERSVLILQLPTSKFLLIL